MHRKLSLIAIALVLATGVATTYSTFAERAVPAMGTMMNSGGQGRMYDVTITNVTRGQQLTPVLVVTHRRGIHLFEAGSPASAELATLAETGNPGPLMALLSVLPGVGMVNVSAGLLDPGSSVTVEVEGGGSYRYVSAVAMLIPTNDAFFALDGVRLPGRSGSAAYSASAYDAGTEVNDELCASIPGPNFVECGGPGSGGAPEGGEEGFVHIHAGIHGIGDMIAAERDWRNPVVRVQVDRTNNNGDGDDDDDDS